MTKIEPGWYRDPAAPQTQRYWNGEHWIGMPVGIDETPPETPEPEPEPKPEPVAPAGSGVAAGRTGTPGNRAYIGLGKPTAEQIDKVMAGRVLASPGQRLVARIIDLLVILALNMVVNGYFIFQYVKVTVPVYQRALQDPSKSPWDLELPDQAYQLQVFILIIGMLLWFAYEVPGTVKRGQTLGKRAVGIAAVSLLDDRLRWSQAFSRWSLLMMPFICFPAGVIVTLLDGLWCLGDKPFRQCLHDKSAATMVVLKPYTPSSPSKGTDNVPSDQS